MTTLLPSWLVTTMHPFKLAAKQRLPKEGSWLAPFAAIL
jgi:hypothetical protein